MSNVVHSHSPKDPLCRRVFESLSEYLDGELTPEDCRQVEAHIADCPPCVDFLESLKETIAASRHLDLHAAPPSMPPEVLAKLTEAWQNALKRRGPTGSFPTT